MSGGASFLAELRRRNVLRAGLLYIGAVWALAQGISQLGPSFGAPEWFTRWFVIAAAIGFPFWLLFAWFYEWTPHGFRLEREVAPGESVTPRTGRKFDIAIIAVLALAVVLLLAERFRPHPPVETAALDGSIAVLPLANEGGDAEQQYFSDGISEDLITALSQFGGLKVIGRSSSFQFRGSNNDAKTIGAKLGVATILEGSVRHAGDIVRISAALINVADSRTLWSQHFDRPYKDLFALQDEITQAVAAALKARLLPAEARLLQGDPTAAQADRPPSGSLDAYSAFLQGNFYRDRSTEADTRKAIDQFALATRLDPRYARAWAGLAFAWTNLAARHQAGAMARTSFADARKAVDTALALAPELSVVHAARANWLVNSEFDWNGAHAELVRATQLSPNDSETKFSLAISSATLGQVERAIDLGKQALDNNPLAAGKLHFQAKFLRAAGRLDDAVAALDRAIELQPGAARYRNDRVMVEVLRGNAASALALARQGSEDDGWMDLSLAFALEIGPDRAAADAALARLIERNAELQAYQIAEAYALRRDADKTFEWLDRASANRDAGVQYLLYDPLILRYRDDARFAAYCRKVGLPVTTQAWVAP